MSHDDKKGIGMRRARRLARDHGAETRSLACQLLGGDPFQAARVMRAVFLELRTARPEEVAPGEKLAAWLADALTRRCLIITGNAEVADWEGYMEKHPGDQVDDVEYEDGVKASPAQEPVTTARPTRHARVVLRLVRERTAQIAEDRLDAETSPAPSRPPER